ncbi:MAG: glutamate racemase [Candidatus Omnitrophica bacterium]|nr:glutamate racemase [Candidatus Omnitrophota bacterium]
MRSRGGKVSAEEGGLSARLDLLPGDRPIGVFDSGIGGLTVAQEITRLLPNEQIVYFGDTARVPYGTKSRESVVRFSRDNMNVLLKYNVKVVVVACNTSTSWALGILRREYALPVVGVIEPGSRRAVEVSDKGRIGVIATRSTVASRKYEETIRRMRPGAEVIQRACPLFVQLVEEGWLDHHVTEQIAQEYLADIRKFGVDTLILGCTHYPLLKPVLQKVVGRNVALIDSGTETAREVKMLLEDRQLLRCSRRPPRHEFLVSDEPEHFRVVAKRFLGHDLPRVRRVLF